ncbi:MAG: hypothetical protein FWC72_00435, partial [Oscillospiraceae bacterium]|nr:hypothetical protein [Oscillospiraceae bacterium]
GNKDTSGAVDFIWKLRKRRGVSPTASAEIFATLCERGFPGLYYGLGTKEKRYNRQVSSENARRLYEISMKLCGVTEALKEAV